MNGVAPDLKLIFGQAVEIESPTERAAYLDEACGRDSPLRSEVERLLLAAKQAGKLRYIGFTGHKDPTIHLAMLEAAERHGFRFDTVMFPMNVFDAHYKSFEKQVLPVALQKNMGVMSMKPICSGDALASKTVSAVECLQYALNLPSHVVITGCDSIGVLEQAINTVTHFQPLTKEQVEDLLGRTKQAAMSGEYEKFKTSDKYDSTEHHKTWLRSAQIQPPS